MLYSPRSYSPGAEGTLAPGSGGFGHGNHDNAPDSGSFRLRIADASPYRNSRTDRDTSPAHASRGSRARRHHRAGHANAAAARAPANAGAPGGDGYASISSVPERRLHQRGFEEHIRRERRERHR